MTGRKSTGTTQSHFGRKKLRDAFAQGGADAVGAIGGGRLLNEEALLLEKTLRGLGVANIDWRAGRQRQATPGRFGGTYADLERAQAIVAFGRPPSQTAPVLDLRIRKAVSRHDTRFVTVGQHAAESFVPSIHLASIDELAPLLETAERVALIWDGIDLEVGRRAAGIADALAAKHVDVHTYIPGEQNNARGAEAFGLLPRAGGLGTDGMLRSAQDGTLRVLSLFGANPVLYNPRGVAAVREALENVPFVVATELFLTETALLADLVLPVRGAFEKDGHVYDLGGDVLPVNAAHMAPDGPLSDGEILVALAAELGIAIPAPHELLEQATAPLPAASYGLGDAAFSEGFAPVPVPSDGLRVAVAANIFGGGGTVRFDDALGELRPRATATFAPATASALGVSQGDVIDLAASEERALRNLIARVSDVALPDIVTILDGISDAPANAFRDGEAVRVTDVRIAGDAARVAALSGMGQ